MKKLLVISILLGLYVNSLAKTSVEKIEVSFDKTIVIVFDANVNYYDVGSPDVLVEKVQNKIKLKAGIENFKETNIFIETENGGLFEFILIYNNDPKKLLHKYGLDNSALAPKKSAIQDIEHEQKLAQEFEKYSPQVKETKEKEELLETLESNSKKVEDKNTIITENGVISKKVRFFLAGIYVKDDHMYFKTEIQNDSHIDYDIDFIKLVVKSGKSLFKKSAVQEHVKNPVFTLNDSIKRIEGKSSQVYVFAIEKFTIDNKKKLYFELWERGGDRKIDFSINANDILSAQPLR